LNPPKFPDEPLQVLLSAASSVLQLERIREENEERKQTKTKETDLETKFPKQFQAKKIIFFNFLCADNSLQD
jgi:hypothetical protein